METSDRIAETLFGKTRRRVLALLFGRPDHAFYLRQIARMTDTAVRGVQRELKRLTAAGLITRMEEGRQVYFRANPRSPVFDELCRLVEKTTGLADQVRAALAPLHERGDASVVFIFGSVATGEHVPGSDVDLMIIGDAGLRDLVPALRAVQDRLAREINPSVYGAAEFRQRVVARDPFITTVMKGPKLMLFGSEDDVARLGGEPLAEAT